MNGKLRTNSCIDARQTRSAFEAMLRPCFDSLYRTALRMCGDHMNAQDIVQETCLKAYKGFSSYQYDTNFKAWIFRILKNHCIDSHRKSMRSPKVELNEDFPDMAGHTDKQYSQYELQGAELHLLNKSFRAEALHAMRELSPDIRIVVILALLEEISYQEIAEVVGCPIGTVRSRVSRGRGYLKESLKDYNPESAKTDHKVTEAVASKGQKVAG